MAESDESSAERSEEPTQRRLEKAREEGQIVRSKELNTTAILLAGASGMLLFGASTGTRLMEMMSFNFRLDRQLMFDPSQLVSHLGASVGESLFALWPFFILMLIAALLGPIGLGGWNFSTKAITPNFGRLNPLSGLKRMFGLKALMELAKAVAKVLVVAVIALAVIYFSLEDILGIREQDIFPAMRHSLLTVAWAVLIMSCAMILITAVDIPFQIQEHMKKLRMTLQQVKDEMKDTEGRPEVKSKIRQLQQQMAQSRMMDAVPGADVVITNPSHYSVALKYDQSKQGAPILVAKGADLIAYKIRELAAVHKVPLVAAPPLARSIYFNTEIGKEIPAGLYVAVAQVLAYVYKLEEHARGRVQKPVLPEEFDIPEDLQHD